MLTNLDSNQHVHCKVVSVRASESARGYVELEFTHRTAGFWGSSVALPKPASSFAAPQVSPVISEKQPPAQQVKVSSGTGSPSAAPKPSAGLAAQSSASPAILETPRAPVQAAPPLSAVAALAAR